MTPVFMYGLFMDVDMLVEMGLEPDVLGKAELGDFRIKMGARATLLPHDGSVVYGMLIRLSESDLDKLYSAPGLEDYCASPASVVLMEDGRTKEAVVYLVPESQAGQSRDRDYRQQLAQLVRESGFPDAYANEIETSA